MITVITGQPGNGKTLFALGYVEKIRIEAELAHAPRVIWYSGIDELTLPWLPLPEAEKWNECAEGAVIVIDECQRVFPVRKVGAVVPAHVQALETHRHRGIDLVLITQHPQLLDIAVRKLAGRHLHLRRAFGQSVARVQQWERCVDPHDRSVQATALTSSFPFPTERFTWYKSAELHTVKKELPWRKILVLAGAAAGVVIFATWAAFRLGALGDVEPVTVAKGQAKDRAFGQMQPGSARSLDWSPGAMNPRIQLWPWSAPFYDPVGRVVSAPKIAGCLHLRFSDGRDECRCATQQGTAATIDRESCMGYLERGVFDASRSLPDAKAQNVAYLERRSSGGQADPGGAAAPNSEPRQPLGGVVGQ